MLKINSSFKLKNILNNYISCAKNALVSTVTFTSFLIASLYNPIAASTEC